MQEGRGETPCVSSYDQVGALSKWFLLLTNYDMKKNSEKEKRYVHTPSQRVKKLIQSVSSFQIDVSSFQTDVGPSQF